MCHQATQHRRLGIGQVMFYNAEQISYKIVLIMQKGTKQDEHILSSKRFSTVYEGFDHDEQFVRRLHNLAQISASIVNPLKLEKQLDDSTCQDVALMAQLHRDASRPNSSDLVEHQMNSSLEEIKKCPCGCNNTKGNDIPFCIEEYQLKFMGSSLSLSLLFFRVVILGASCTLGILGIFAFLTNYVSNQEKAQTLLCNDQPYCLFKIRASLVNKQNDILFTAIQQWLGVIACIVLVCLLRGARIYGMKLHDEIDKTTKTPSDCAIKLQNLPYGQSDEEEIVQLIKVKDLEIKLKLQDSRSKRDVKAIHIVYNLEEGRRRIEKLRQQIINLDALLKDYKTGELEPGVEKKYQSLKLELVSNLQSLQDFKKRFLNEKLFRRKLATTCCIVQFNSEFGKDHFLDEYGNEDVGVWDQIRLWLKRQCYKQQKQIFFKGNLLSIQRAPQPEDILWENCQKMHSLSRIVSIWISTMLIILVSLGIIIGLQIAQESISNNPDLAQNEAVLGYIISFVLMIVNNIIWVVLFWLIKIEYNHTTSEEVISRVNKTIILQSLNCIVLPMISSMLIKARERVSDNTYGGLTVVGSQALDYSISNCVVKLIFLYFDIGHIIKWLLLQIIGVRNKIIRYLARDNNKSDEINYVRKVNQLYEGPDFDITNCYVYLVGNMMHCAFYCTLQPILLLVVSVCTILFYYVKKYLLLRRYGAPKMLSFLVYKNAISGMNYVPLFYATGCLVFTSVVHDFQIVPSFWIPGCISLAVSLFNLINPSGVMNSIALFIYKRINIRTDLQQKKASLSQVAINPASVSPTKLQQSPTKASGTVKKKEAPENLEVFKRNLHYFFHNHVNTLFGWKNLLLGKSIDDKIRKQTKDFVEKFCDAEEAHPCTYPTQEVEEGESGESSKEIQDIYQFAQRLSHQPTVNYWSNNQQMIL